MVLTGQDLLLRLEKELEERGKVDMNAILSLINYKALDTNQHSSFQWHRF